MLDKESLPFLGEKTNLKFLDEILYDETEL